MYVHVPLPQRAYVIDVVQVVVLESLQCHDGSSAQALLGHVAEQTAEGANGNLEMIATILTDSDAEVDINHQKLRELLGFHCGFALSGPISLCGPSQLIKIEALHSTHGLGARSPEVPFPW